MFDTLRAIAASHDTQVLIVLLALAIFSAVALPLAVILSFFRRFQTTNNKYVWGLIWWALAAIALRMFGMWCAGL